jgi:hypothetical protein
MKVTIAAWHQYTKKLGGKTYMRPAIKCPECGRTVHVSLVGTVWPHTTNQVRGPRTKCGAKRVELDYAK